MNVELLNGNVLAYIGDGVMSLTVRCHFVELGYSKASQLQLLCNSYVSANAQAMIVLKLLQEDFLNDKELAIYHLGRNYKTSSRAKNTDVQTYRIASGFEAVWGYLYLSNNPQRIKELWDKCRTIVEGS